MCQHYELFTKLSILGLSAGVQNGHRWRTTRGHFDPSFSHSTSLSFRSIFSAELRQWLADLQPAGVNTFQIDALNACRVLPFKLIAYACYGSKMLSNEVRPTTSPSNQTNLWTDI